eukprot:TRINITY_DN92119_c0_g1_i1.p1 TRINITY_DN92119_c0_g1~~TRINITY_DN92119_c0_g1_i1.p1  ORF type:complete len:1012 (+),score=235.42 TRINITY_DN92119_c0_g1_i1:57-3038(+)
MEDLAVAFQEDFFEAVKVLEDFSSSDYALRGAMGEIRRRIAAKRYVCAPNFWDDLRATLGAIESSKAHQVLKQIARLEVKFWAKESLGMLKELDPESRLERIADWLQTFGTSDFEDQSSGPAVLYQVLNDVTLQKDFEAPQREALSCSVRENLHKFPVEMQAVLERVGSLTGGGRVAAAGLSDWRRRHNIPTQLDEPTLGLGAKLLFGVGPHETHVPMASSTAPPTASVDGHVVADEEQEAHQPDDEVAALEAPAFSEAQVDPKLLKQAREQVLKLLELNSEGCPRKFVRARLEQLGISGLPIAALGGGVFFSGKDIYLRHAGFQASASSTSTARLPIPEELRQQMVEVVREAGGKISISQMAERLQWQPGSARHGLHGPLRKALAQATDLFFEPEKVFTLAVARKMVLLPGFVEEVEEPVTAEQAPEAETVPGAVPYVADSFAELISTVMIWLQQGGGTLDREAVLPLIKALGFKVRAVISALSRDVFWSHQDAECQILMRTAVGQSLHSKPLPSNYMHEQVRRSLIAEVKSLGTKAKYSNLAGSMGWNIRSELRRTYGALPIVLQGLVEVFYDPTKLYLKQVLEGIVEWPVGKDGRIGPNSSQDHDAVRHWTTAADDLKGVGDMAWFHCKRQLLGVAMSQGGRCEVQVARQVLQPAGTSDGATLEQLFEPGHQYNLSKVLFWEPDRAFRRREAVGVLSEDVPEAARQAMVQVMKASGSATLAELKVAVDAAMPDQAPADEDSIRAWAQLVPELFFAPDYIFLRHVVNAIIDEAPVVEEPEKQIDEEEAFMRAGLAEVAAAAAAVEVPEEPLAIEAPAEAGKQEATGAGAKRGFFSFDGFAASKKADDLAASPPKRQRLTAQDAGRLGAAPGSGYFGDEAPPWVTEGAAVRVRREQSADLPGVIMAISGDTCTVRLELPRPGSEPDVVEEELPLPSLLPESPAVGKSVKVVGGDRTGCMGKLVGLAGSEGVVQIGGMSYVTLPMSQLAVIAA